MYSCFIGDGIFIGCRGEIFIIAFRLQMQLQMCMRDISGADIKKQLRVLVFYAQSFC